MIMLVVKLMIKGFQFPYLSKLFLTDNPSKMTADILPMISLSGI
jgi:hypothetical protein